MSIKEIEARRDAELADIDRKIKAAHDKGDENEAERLEAFHAKRAADYFIQMTRDPEYTDAMDGLRGLHASFSLTDGGPDMARIADTMNMFSAGAAHMADAVERHVAGRRGKRPAKLTAERPAKPAAAKPAKPEAAGNSGKTPAVGAVGKKKDLPKPGH